MPQNPDSLPSDFFKSKTPDSLPSDFFNKRESADARKRHTLTGKGSGESTPPKPLSDQMADLVEGTGKVASIGTLPVAMAINPGATIAGVAGGYLADKAGQKAAEAAGASPGVSRLAGQAAGLAGAGVSAKYGPRAVSALGAGAKAMTPDWMTKLHGKLSDALSAVSDTWNSYGKAKPSPKAELPSPQPSKIAKPETEYRARGERDPRDLGKLPGDKETPKVVEIRKPTDKSAPQNSVDIARQLADAGKESGTFTESHLKSPVEEPAVPKSASTAPQSSVTRVDMLVDILRKANATPELARMVTPEQWKTIAQSAGLKEPPNEATIKAAIDLLGKPKQIRVTRR